ncbi:MAG: isoamylase [Treponemataceae bacterium]
MNVKKISAFLLLLLIFHSAFALTEDEEYYVQNLITDLTKVQAPKVSEGFVIFTADKNSRFTGIAFDFEGYKTVHPFYRNISYDIDLKPQDSILFYICKIPEKVRKITYRLVIDGIWTTDPVNPNKFYDYEADTYLSYVEILTPELRKTEKLFKPQESSGEKNLVNFVYQGKAGQRIRLGGNFTNWDSYIYELKETKEGFYEISLYLPPGLYYYNFYKGTSSFLDSTNPKKAYTDDGRIVSAIEIF